MLVGWRAQLIHTGPSCLGLELILPPPGEKSQRGLGWRYRGSSRWEKSTHSPVARLPARDILWNSRPPQEPHLKG